MARDAHRGVVDRVVGALGTLVDAVRTPRAPVGTQPAADVGAEALVAHLLRRTSFGPLPGQVDALAPGGVPAALDSVLVATPQDPGPTPDFATQNAVPLRWITLMGQPTAGLHEKMVWYWHGHLTSSQTKVGFWQLMYQQHLLFRRTALGSFSALMQAVTVDPAMLLYLDGAGSVASAPNENYGREVMELFTLGRDKYTQDDVRAAAYAFSGWTIAFRTGTARFTARLGPSQPSTFLHKQVQSASDVIDVICADPQCARWIATGLFAYLAGVPPTKAQLERHAGAFSTAGLAIAPLVTSILRDPDFFDMRLNRPRYPIEWLIAASGALGLTGQPEKILEATTLLDQTPYRPPNVAGWPATLDWNSPAFMAAHAKLAVGAAELALVGDVDLTDGGGDPVTAALARCSVYEVSDDTRRALEQANQTMAADPQIPARVRTALLVALTTTSPEMVLA